VVGIAVLILNEAGDLGNATTDPDGSNARSTTRSSADAFIARGRGAAASPRRTVKDVAIRQSLTHRTETAISLLPSL
jgi:hypothetical protein